MLRLLTVLIAVTGCGSDGRTDPRGVDGGALASFGEPCRWTEDCASGLCIETGRGAICTRACGGESDCPSSPNWGCVAPAELDLSVCGCASDASEEVCGDGLDNDCDARVDDCLMCEGRFVDRDDPDHCGRCGNACRTDQACTDGECVCPIGRTQCGDACVTLGSDDLHCGACGNACPPSQDCVSGTCRCTDPTRLTFCGIDGCVDTAENASHCGECDNACPAAQVCDAGTCVCPSSATPDYCPGAGCVRVATDVTHCGECGNACPSGWVCAGGVCSCPPDRPDDCGGACVATASDSAHCGSCGNVCSAPHVCLGGTCRCPIAGETACGGTCVSTSTNTAHCGTCGNACLSGEYCSAGSCVCASGLVCGSVCVSSSDRLNCGACGNACGSSQYCFGGTCRCSTAGLTACGTECVSLSSDGANCGACGNACRPSEVCASGTCRCPTGQLWCDSVGGCVDVTGNTSHCGACDNGCRTTEICSFGSCRCPYSYQQWCASAGACVNVNSDSLHCGACDAVCPPETACSSGTCRCTTFGETLCGTTCHSLASDPSHCGACGRACSGTMQCISSACGCPPPAVGTEVRVTETVEQSEYSALATDGTRALAVWIEESRTVEALYGRLLNLDGTPVGLSFVLDPNVQASSRPDVIWDGTRYLAAYYGGGGLRILPISAAGVVGTATVANYDAPWDPRLAWSPASGLAVVGRFSSVASDTYFQKLGLDGATPSPPMLLGVSRGHAIAADAAGGWAVLESYGTSLTLVYINADGSRTRTPAVISGVPGPPAVANLQIEHDGTTWVAAWGTRSYASSSTIETIVLARGTSLERSTIVASSSSSSPSGRMGDVGLTVRGSDVVVAWVLRPASSGTTIGSLMGELLGRRYTAPPTATSAATPLGGAFSLLSTTTAHVGSGLPITHVGSDRLVYAWSDGRWGDYEIYARGADLLGCAP